MKAKQFCLALMCACIPALLSQSPFIVTRSPSDKDAPSRNEVKESIGSRLHDVVKVAARIQGKVGKMMMQLAALQTTIAAQAQDLIEDEPPFNTASTDVLARAEEKMGEQVGELESLLESLEALAERVQQTVRLK